MSSPIDHALEAIETEAAITRERLQWLERLAAELRTDASVREVPAAEPSSDAGLTTRILEFVGSHPGSTAGPIAKRYRLNRQNVAVRLNQLTKGPGARLVKLSRGYALAGGAANAMSPQDAGAAHESPPQAEIP